MAGTSSDSKVAVVTGAGRRRIGNVVARMLAERGFSVALHYRTSRESAEATVGEMRSSGGTAACFQADVSREGDVERLFAEVQERFGRLDALVTTAAVWDPIPLEQTDADAVRRQFEINTLGTFLCSRAAGLIMVEQPEGGTIVTVGDWAVVRPYTDYAAYFVSKGAIPTMTRSLAVEFAKRNPAVRVNAVLPGPVMLPADLTSDERRRVVADTLLGREGRPENVGQAVLFFVENDYVTGACLPVDGGRSIAGSEGDRTS